MNKKQLVRKIAEKCEYNQKTINDVLTLYFDTVKETVANEEINIINFGTFKTVIRKERLAYNPNTKTKVKVPAKLTPIFKVSKIFKREVRS